MGSVNAKAPSKIVLPEIFIYSQNKVLLVHGTENGREFWWPPGAYWLCEKACDLEKEQPEQWIRRVLTDQLGVLLNRISLRSVEMVAPNHPPVLIYEAQTNGEMQPSYRHEFDDAKYFDLAAMPSSLGRDDEHGKWLRLIIERTPPTMSA